MNHVMEFAGLIGGIGAIIVAVASFASKIWADWFMKKKTAEYDKQFEYYKNSLELEREKYKALHEQVIHKDKTLFDTEFEIYKDISPKLINAVDSITRWLTLDQLSDESHEIYMQSMKEFNDTFAKYALFIDKNIFNLLNDFQSFLTITEINIEFNSKKYDTYRYNKNKEDNYFDVWMEIGDKSKEIINKKEEVITKVREYLRNIATIK